VEFFTIEQSIWMILAYTPRGRLPRSAGDRFFFDSQYHVEEERANKY
jgi:hypothetical protein